MPFDFDPTPSPGEYFDFNPVFETAMGAPQPSDPGQKSKTIPEEYISPREIDLLDFMDRIQHSPDMVLFVKPFNDLLNWIRDEGRKLRNQGRFDRIDQRFLSHLAANYGLQLIDLPFATERERRRMLRDVVQILQRRGTLWSIRRICENLGFTVSFEERYQVSGYWNGAKYWNPNDITQSVVDFDFAGGDMQGWTNSANTEAYAAAGKLRLQAKAGTGSSYLNTVLYGNPPSGREFQIKTTYRIQGTGDCHWALVLRLANATNYITLDLKKSGATETLEVNELVAGISINHVTIDISGESWRSHHELVVWDDGASITAIIDGKALAYKVAYLPSSLTVNYKGAWIAEGTVVDIENYLIRSVDRRKQPLFYDSTSFDKTLVITLSGTPYQDSAKREYLSSIIPFFVPFGTDLQFA